MTRSSDRPPRLPLLLVRLLTDEEGAEALIGDLEERFRQAGASRRARRALYWEVLASTPSLFLRAVGRRLEPSPDGAGRHRGPWWSDVGREASTTLRSLARKPGYTTVVVATLGLGVGATASIYSVIDAVMFRPLPYEEPERLAIVLQTLGGESDRGVAPADIDYMTGRLESFHSLAWFLEPESMTFTGQGEPEHLRGRRVSVGFFDMLEVDPLVGRAFESGEDVDGRDDVLVLSHSIWDARFGADPAIVGQTLTINNRALTVLGVLPPSFGFELGGSQDLFVPRVFDPASGNYGGWHSDGLVGRLRDGVGLEAADAEVRAMAATLEEEFPVRRDGVLMRVAPFRQHLVGDTSRILLALLGAAGMVMLVVCANLMHLALARLSNQRYDLALRVALGASRGRLLRRQLIEATILSTLGLTSGLAIATGAVPVLTGLSPAEIPGLAGTRIDLRVFAVMACVAALTTVVLGTLPFAMVASGLHLDVLRSRGSGESGRRVREVVMAAETAVVSALLLVAVLLAQSLDNVRTTDPGFDTRGRTAVELTLPAERYPTVPEIQTFFREVIGRLETLPGVVSVGGSSTLPLQGQGITIPAPIPEGQDLEGPAVSTRPRTGWDAVTRGYFRAAGIPLLRGRTFNQDDDATDAIPSIVINQAFEDAVFGPDDPIGARVGFGTPPSLWMEVVGVVGAVRHGTLRDEGRIAFYQLAEQTTFAWPTMEIVIQAEPGVAISAAAVREAVWEVDPDQPVTRIRLVRSVLEESVAAERYQAVLTGSFALLALLLAAVGIYGVVSYATGLRRREFGVRLALGAAHTGIRHMVIRGTLVWIGSGVVVGIAAGVGIGSLVQARLHGVSPSSPTLAVLVAATLIATGVVAAYLPARRASRADPLDALREG